MRAPVEHHGGEPHPAGVPGPVAAGERRPAPLPRDAVGAGRVLGGHPVGRVGVVQGVHGGPQVPLPAVVPDDRVLHRGRAAAGQDRAGSGRRQALDRLRLHQVDPPVLGAGGGAADVETPGALRGVHQRGALQRLRPEGVLADRHDGGEAHPVVRAGHHVGEPPPLADRPAEPVGQPPRAVDQLRRRAAGPGARARVLRLQHHLGVGPERPGVRRSRTGRRGSAGGHAAAPGSCGGLAAQCAHPRATPTDTRGDLP